MGAVACYCSSYIIIRVKCMKYSYSLSPHIITAAVINDLTHLFSHAYIHKPQMFLEGYALFQKIYRIKYSVQSNKCIESCLLQKLLEFPIHG